MSYLDRYRALQKAVDDAEAEGLDHDQEYNDLLILVAEIMRKDPKLCIDLKEMSDAQVKKYLIREGWNDYQVTRAARRMS